MATRDHMIASIIGLAALLTAAVPAVAQDGKDSGQEGHGRKDGNQKAAPAAEKPDLMLGPVERVSVYLKSKRIVVAGEVQLRRSKAVELIACARGGKTHESIFLLKCRPSDLNAALKLIGCKYVSGPVRFQDPVKPVGTRLICTVEWSAKGKTVTRRVEDLAWDVRYGKPMPRIAWVYVGSKFAVDPRDGQEVFVADKQRNLITTLHDPYGLLDNPLPSGGDVTAGRYVANPKALPPERTQIRVTIRRATEKEVAASKKVEAAAEVADKAWRAKRLAELKREREEREKK